MTKQTTYLIAAAAVGYYLWSRYGAAPSAAAQQVKAPTPAVEPTAQGAGVDTLIRSIKDEWAGSSGSVGW